MPGGICIAPMPLLGVLVAFAAEGKLDRLGGGRWTASLLRLPSCGRTVSVTGLRPGGMGGGPTEDSFSRIRSLLLPCHGSGDAIRSCDHCSEDDPCRMCWACCGCSSNDAWSGRKDGMAGICGGAVRRNLCLSATEPCDGPDCALAFRCSGPSCCLRSNSPEWRCAVGILSPLPPLCQSASVLARWRPAVELLGSTSSRSCLKLTPVTAFGLARTLVSNSSKIPSPLGNRLPTAGTVLTPVAAGFRTKENLGATPASAAFWALVGKP